MELAILGFPYDSWGTPFQQLKQVVEEPSPQLPADKFSPDFVDFTSQWCAVAASFPFLFALLRGLSRHCCVVRSLKKVSKERPTYAELMVSVRLRRLAPSRSSTDGFCPPQKHPFFTTHDGKDTDVAAFVKVILGDC